MICERCGRKYRVSDAMFEFAYAVGFGFTYKSSVDGHLCSECALDYIRERYDFGTEYDEEDEEEEDWDIWSADD